MFSHLLSKALESLRCGQADVSSAYNVAGVGNDAHGNPAKIFVRKTSWDHAVQMIRGDDGVTRAAIDWDCRFKEYRDILVARVAAGKKVIPEIYQRYLNPAEKLLTLAQNTYEDQALAVTGAQTIFTLVEIYRLPPLPPTSKIR